MHAVMIHCKYYTAIILTSDAGADSVAEDVVLWSSCPPSSSLSVSTYIDKQYSYSQTYWVSCCIGLSPISPSSKGEKECSKSACRTLYMTLQICKECNIYGQPWLLTVANWPQHIYSIMFHDNNVWMGHKFLWEMVHVHHSLHPPTTFFPFV